MQHYLLLLLIPFFILNDLDTIGVSSEDSTIDCIHTNSSNIKLSLFTRRHPLPVTWIASDAIPLKDSTYDIRKKTKILIYEFVTTSILSYDSSFISYDPMKNAYLEMMNVNVITVDYSKYSSCDFNSLANYVVVQVAEAIINVIEQLQKYGTSPNMFHIIGYSIGAHIAGYVGKHLPFLIGRITGLDPLGYTYNILPQNRLNQSNAQFVDQITTDSSVLGTNQECGRANFYVNGGVRQYMCEPSDNLCSHQKCVDYFVESIYYRNRYCARKCNNYSDYESGLCAHNEVQHMGEYCNSKANGTYYLDTNCDPIYGKLCCGV